MLTHYVLVFALAMLSIIAIDDLNLSRLVGVTVSHSKIIHIKICRNIRRLRLSWYVHQRKLRRA